MVVCHNCVVHAIHLFSPITPSMMGWIVLRFMDFDKGPINRSNATLELWNLCCQNLSLLNSGLANLVNNYIIDARYNKYAIIIYCTFALIPHEGTMLVTLSCFMNEMKLTKHCFRANLDSHPKMQCGSFVNFA